MRKSASFFGLFLLSAAALSAEPLPLRPDGTVPLWLTNGPFEIRTIGFGDLSDEAPLPEDGLAPRNGEVQNNPAVPAGASPWLYLAPLGSGFADFQPWYGWKTLTTPEKIWYARIVYSWAGIISDQEQPVRLRFGGNTIVRILLNDSTIYRSLHEVNAVRDGFTVAATLRKGLNRLLVVTSTSHRNHAAAFFDPLRFEWGFYLRLCGDDGRPLTGLALQAEPDRIPPDFSLTPTFFYRQAGSRLRQKYLLEIKAGLTGMREPCLILPALHETIRLQDAAPGITARTVWLPELPGPLQTTARLQWGGAVLEKGVELKPLPRYELYFMPMTHMDIGYTNPQPVVIERQLQTLDQAISKCATDPDFRWTIETMWLLENYRLARSPAAFKRLIALIKAGRIAVSPISTNPYTGWVSETEMAAAFRLAEVYHQRYGLEYFTAVYNDVPGQSWALPQYLRKAGVPVLVDGINEIFSDYKYQKNLPKVFRWAGASRDTVLLYLTEAYVEGARYGLERDTTAIATRIWHRVNNLLQRGYPWTRILISGAFSDNSGIALAQYEHAREWNKHYAWPRFVIATLNDFGRAVAAQDRRPLKTVRGDWTSDWDILFQGETRRMIEYREVQNQLPGVEVLATFSSALHPASASGAEEIDAVYTDLLNFSGHGSGLEYGLGSREENLYTDAVRAEAVHGSWMRTRALRERLLYRLTAPKESFDSHGVMVFNTLTWSRSMPVEIGFPENDPTRYEVIDLATGARLPAHQSGARLCFIAPEVPGIGRRQFELVPAVQHSRSHPVDSASDPDSPSCSAAVDPRQSGLLPASSTTIENTAYRVGRTEKGWMILDKKNGMLLFDPGAALPALTPLRKRFQLGESFVALDLHSGAVQVERNPVYEEITSPWEDPLFRTLRLRLWHDLNRIDVTVELDLTGQSRTAYTEEYGLAFSFNARAGIIRCETLGGWTSLEDRFAGAGHTYFSIRRAAEIESDGSILMLASPDCRIFALDTLRGGSTLIANLLNNFPDSWNRNEEKQGQVTWHFTLARADGTTADPAAFGWEAASGPLIRRSYFTRTEPLQCYLSASNPRIQLLSLRPAAEPGRYEMLLRNSDPGSRQQVTLRSDLLLTAARVQILDLLGRPQGALPVLHDSVTLSLAANEFTRLGIDRRETSRKSP
ncbi:MAG TPA: hypothetical protein PLG50_02640 [bacterium]|nr:hypothetical protein [bacterium]HQG44542.1 hypothetical protein [bacterium]HQI48459.1 hypothetical protein [bacterium]HQJ66352.1 hypothetical protein [bacterium]